MLKRAYWPGALRSVTDDVTEFSELVSGRLTDDFVLPFSLENADVRGRVVRLGPMVTDILGRHEYPPAVGQLLGEAVALTALLGASLKFDGRFVVQAKTDGPVDLLVTDFTTPGHVRGYAHFDADAVASSVSTGDGASMLGVGHLAMTIDQGADMDLYQGIVPLDCGTLADASLEYFRRSEQIPTAIRLGAGQISTPEGGDGWRAGGIVIQHLPASGPADFESHDEGWQRSVALFETVEYDEILDPVLAPERLLYRLFHEDGVRVTEPLAVNDDCRCSEERIRATLSRFGFDDLEDMVEDGAIRVNCEFCNRTYLFQPDDIIDATS